MVTLFQMMTLDSWSSGVMRPIGNVYPAAFFFFLVFVGLSSLGMLNLLTAIFVESLASLTKAGAIEEAALAKERRERLLSFIESTFKEFDKDKSGTLDHAELDVAFNSFDLPIYQAKFEELGFSVETMKAVMAFCDVNGDGTVEYEELCAGISSMNDDPVKKDTWEIMSKLSKIDKKLQSQLMDLNTKMDLLLKDRGLYTTWEADREAEAEKLPAAGQSKVLKAARETALKEARLDR